MADIAPVPGIGMGGADPVMRKILSRGDQMQADAKNADAQLQASYAKTDELRKAQATALAPSQAALKDKVQQGAPVPAPALPSPEAPKPPQLNPQEMRDTLGLIVALASIGGALTRHPLTAALNNFAAGADGVMKGQADVYSKELKEFEANFKKAKEENDRIWQRYQAAQTKYGADIRGLQEELRIIAAETQSPIDMELAHQTRIIDLYNLHEKADANYNKVLETIERMKETDAHYKQMHEEHVATQAELLRHHKELERLSGGRANAADAKRLEALHKQWVDRATALHNRYLAAYNKEADPAKRAELTRQYTESEKTLFEDYKKLGMQAGDLVPGGAAAPAAPAAPAPAAAPAAPGPAKPVPVTAKEAPVVSKYKTADEVKAAYKAGDIERDDAMKILVDQFGFTAPKPPSA